MRAKIFAIWIIFYLVGTLTAPYFEVTTKVWLTLGLMLCIISFLLFQKRYFWAIILGFGILFLSVYQFQSKELEYLESNEKLAGKKSEFVGTVTTLPTPVEHGSKVTIDLESVDGVTQKNRAIIYIKTYPEVKFVETLKFRSKLKPYGDKKNRLMKDRVIGEMSVNEFEVIGHNKDLSYRLKGALFSIRTAFNDALKKALPQEEAGLASGLILGEKALISPEFTRSLQNSGTSHIIALSGYNITIILSLFIVFQMKLSRRLNLVLPLIFIIFFVVMTGASASIVRAGIMGFMPILAKYMGRSSNSFMAILVSAFVMVIFNPFIVLYDVGFQLSFTALCGMIYLGPIISRFFSSFPKMISFALAETLGAQIATLPLLLFYFGRASIVSPISNLVVLSLVPLGMFVSFIIGIGYLTLPLVGQILAIPGYFILKLFYILINFFGNLPYASTQIKIENPLWLVVSYLILLDIFFLSYKNVKKNKSQNALSLRNNDFKK